MQRMSEHLASEAAGCDFLVLWLDCDREGENICFEVLHTVRPHLSGRALPSAYEGNCYRAKFSSLAPADLQGAMLSLTHPNLDESLSVDARQLIDLKLGVAFSRFQTRYFREMLPQLGKISVTYGPCQSPTLWFCVHRHDQIQTFVSRPFWTPRCVLSVGVVPFEFQSSRGALWSQAEAKAVVQRASGASVAIAVADAIVQTSVDPRPPPLNTLSLLRAASERLGIGPGDTMHYVERLYLNGLVSYPRTETSVYAPAFDLVGTLHLLATGAAEWLPQAAEVYRSAQAAVAPSTDAALLGAALAACASSEGTDAGDHPPITPVKLATPKQCDGEVGWALFQLICRHFVASLSSDCIYEHSVVSARIGLESFRASTTRCVQRGWTSALCIDVDDPTDPGGVAAEAKFRTMSRVRAQQELSVYEQPSSVVGHTEPPPHLSEADLLSLMEAHGIGTDASMATHVSNVIKREYVLLDAATRRLTPSPLGQALVHAYTLIDEGLVLPCVRASIEASCARIARGEASFEAVTSTTIAHFKQRFKHFVKHAHRLPAMLAVALSPETTMANTPAGLAGAAAWSEAVRRTASVDLDELRVSASARVQAAIRGPAELYAGPPPGFDELIQGEAGVDARGVDAAAEVVSLAAAEAAVAEASAQLERLGYAKPTKAGMKGKKVSKKKSGGDTSSSHSSVCGSDRGHGLNTNAAEFCPRGPTGRM